MTDAVTVLQIDKVQAVALAVCTYYLGVWIKHRFAVLDRLSVPSPVVGGMLFAAVASTLEYFGIFKLQIDSTLQTVLMLVFFTTIGLMASLKVLTQGCKVLVGFLAAVTVLL